MASAGLLQHIPRSFTPPRIYSPTRIYLTWSGETLVHDWRGAARAGTRASLTGRQGCQLFSFNICNNQALAMRGFVLCLRFNMQLFCFTLRSHKEESLSCFRGDTAALISVLF